MKVFHVALFLPLLVSSSRLSNTENENLQKTCGLPPATHNAIRRSMHTPEISRALAPWVVRLEYTFEWFPTMTMEERSDSTNGFCSGSLISSRHVLTAAHCIHFNKNIESLCNATGDVLSMNYGSINIDRITVRLAETLNNGGNDMTEKKIQLPVKKAFVSRAYTGFKCTGSEVVTRGDIAVIELAEDVPFSKAVYPACLNNQDIADGTPLQMAGFGRGPNVTHDDKDTDELRLFSSFMSTCAVKASDDVRCTYSRMASTCGGDSGAGHYYTDQMGRKRIVAPLSGGISCDYTLAKQMKGPVSTSDYNTLVKPNLYWICAATGICLYEDAKKTYEIYKEIGLADSWYKTFEKLTGNEVFV